MRINFVAERIKKVSLFFKGIRNKFFNIFEYNKSKLLGREPFYFYERAILLIESGNYKFAIDYFCSFIDLSIDNDQKVFAYINCGLLNIKLRNFKLAISDFTNAIEAVGSNLEFVRLKGFSYSWRSEAKYKLGEYKGSIKDKRIAMRYNLLNISFIFPEYDTNQIDIAYKYNSIAEVSKLNKSRYDLIQYYKNIIDDNKKLDIIRKLDLLSNSKYAVGDYKGSIKALRRAERYY